MKEFNTQKDKEESKHMLAKAAEDAIAVISTATEKAANTIAESARTASSVLSAAAAAAAAAAQEKNKDKSSGDHDRIVVLDTKLDAISNQITKLDDGMARKVEQLENEKLNTRDSYPVLYKAEVDRCIADHESRIRTNTSRIIVFSTVGAALLVALGIAEFIIGKIWK